MKRYADIAHYRAPYKDVMLSGFGADEAPAPIAATPRPQVSGLLAETLNKMLAATTEDADGLAVLNPAVADQLSAELGRIKAQWDGGDVIMPAADAVIGATVAKEPSMLDWMAYLSGRAGAPLGVKVAAKQRPNDYVLVGFGEAADKSIRPVISIVNKESAKLGALRKNSPFFFVLLAPGSKLGPFAASSLKNSPLKQGEAEVEGLSTASMLGYGALGLAAIAGIYLAFGKTKKSPKYESNPRKAKKARKAKKSRKARKARKARRVIRAR